MEKEYDTNILNRFIPIVAKATTIAISQYKKDEISTVSPILKEWNRILNTEIFDIESHFTMKIFVQPSFDIDWNEFNEIMEAINNRKG